MPIYEYRCDDCRKRFSMLTLRISEQVEPRCEHCGSTRAQRLLSRFAMPKSDAERAARLDDPSAFADLDDADPKSMARWMKKAGQQMGDDVPAEDLDEMVDQVESGEGGDEGD